MQAYQGTKGQKSQYNVQVQGNQRGQDKKKVVPDMIPFALSAITGDMLKQENSGYSGTQNTTGDQTGFTPFAPQFWDSSDYINPATEQLTQNGLGDHYNKTLLEQAKAREMAAYNPRVVGSASVSFIPEDSVNYH